MEVTKEFHVSSFAFLQMTEGREEKQLLGRKTTLNRNAENGYMVNILNVHVIVRQQLNNFLPKPI